jgi:predicted PurR-regulated permease PerM
VLGVTNVGLAVARGVVSFVVGMVTIAFLTIFMLIEGPRLIGRFRDSLPEPMKLRWDRVSGDVYRTVGGYVGGNLLISLIAGIGAAIILFALGSEYAIALAVVVAVLDLIPLAGATLAAIIVATISFIELGWVKGVIVVVFFVLYQQLENHILQPIIYGRTVQLSPLTVLVAILIGAELVGILGALAAIPVAGIIQAIFREIVRWRRESIVVPGAEVALPEEPAGGSS